MQETTSNDWRNRKEKHSANERDRGNKIRLLNDSKISDFDLHSLDGEE